MFQTLHSIPLHFAIVLLLENPSQILLILLHVPLMVHTCCLSKFETAKMHPAIDDCRYKVVGIYYPGCDDDDDDEQLLNFKPRYSCQFCAAILGMKL
jgi:hypothetical protein